MNGNRARDVFNTDGAPSRSCVAPRRRWTSYARPSVSTSASRSRPLTVLVASNTHGPHRSGHWDSAGRRGHVRRGSRVGRIDRSGIRGFDLGDSLGDPAFKPLWKRSESASLLCHRSGSAVGLKEAFMKALVKNGCSQIVSRFGALPNRHAAMVCS